ncbi:MAG: chloride channel protein [Bdellovibrionales bacterium]|nr:chloride channel protein [Bdellovibrionales bacterium]
MVSHIFNKKQLLQNNAAYLHVAIWSAAFLVGIAAVLYAKLISWSQALYFRAFAEHPYVLTAMTPALFVIATWLVKRFAKEAKGSGIPQVLEAIEIAEEPSASQGIWIHRLVSVKTAGVKVLSSVAGIFGGASIGREGPTVQIAATVFAWIGNLVRRVYPKADFRSFLTAGAAAGVAAAFNTPLAGITFAIEEVAEGSFGPFKQLVILGVVIAGITAQGLAGNYLYFGRPSIPDANFLQLLLFALPIGIFGGMFGGFFARILSSHYDIPLPKKWWIRALVFGMICAAIGFWTEGGTSGSGYEITRQSLESASNESPGLMFPVWKFITTVLSYISGMAGGIFSPCLTIGAGLGFAFATLIHAANLKACALLGMVSFFSGVVQAPLTAVVIVTEMTDQHALILPFMAAAFLSQSMGKRLMPVPLYRFLANRSLEASNLRIDGE